MQQGRVQIDSDWNEQNDIQTEYDRSYLQDIIGKNGTPLNEYEGFHISPNILLNWDIFPKNARNEDDSKALKAFLKKEFAVGDWIDSENVQFVKRTANTISSDSGEIPTPLHSISITLNNNDPKEATKATLEIDGKTVPPELGGTFIKRKKDGDLYTDRKWYKISCGKHGKQGHYFVDGILCENEAEVDASEQPDLPLWSLNVLFNWDSVPTPQGNDINDLKRLKKILKEEFAVGDWIDSENVQFVKLTENARDKITASSGEIPTPLHSVSITLDNDNDPQKATSAILTYVDSQKTRYEKLAVRHNKDNGNKYIYYYKDKKIALPTKAGRYLVYLDVWERHLTMLDDPAMRESALGGPDTATRTKIIWQVKIFPISDNDINDSDKEIINKIESSWNDVNSSLLPPIHYNPLKDPDFILNSLKYSPKAPDLIGTLSAQLTPPDGSNTNEDICVLPPSAGYQGLENHLYRLEIHQGTNLSDLGSSNKNADTTFKWSVDNAMVVSQISSFSHGRLKIKSIGEDGYLGFSIGQWIEIIDDKRELIGEPGILVKIIGLDTGSLSFDPNSISSEEDLTDENFPQEYNPKLRRWDTITSDSKKGALNIMDQESKKFNNISLGQEGIEVKFADGVYRTGDYWLIPARTAFGNGTGGIEWEQIGNTPKSNPPLGIKHHFNPLAIIKYNDDKTIQVLADCRSFFTPLSNFISLYYVSGDDQQTKTDTDPNLPSPLKCRVLTGNKPAPGHKVEFSIISPISGNATLSKDTTTSTTPVTNQLYTVTDANGFVECYWRLDGNPSSQNRVEARLIDSDILLMSGNNRTDLPTILFNAIFQKPFAAGIMSKSGIIRVKLGDNPAGIIGNLNKFLRVGPVTHNFLTNEGPRPAITLSLDTTNTNHPLIKPPQTTPPTTTVVEYQVLTVDAKFFSFRLHIDTNATLENIPQTIPKTVDLRFWAVPAEGGQVEELDPQNVTPQ
jgi:Family of unknown function (DUF6519)